MHYRALQSANPCSLRASLGFTLLEALVVVALLAILVAMGAPAMSALRQRHQLQAQAEGFLDSLVLARSEALRRQQRVTLCPRAQIAGGRLRVSEVDWQQGWVVFADGNDNALPEEGEAVIEIHAAMPQGITLTVANTVKGYFSYGSEGRSTSLNGAFMAGTWRFCAPVLGEGWLVVSNAMGRPRLEKNATAACR